jgi:hypothetical protein
MNLGTIGSIEIILSAESVKNLVIGTIITAVAITLLAIITKKIK